MTHPTRPIVAAALLLGLAACGGGGDRAQENWARLREFTLTPGVLRAPATATEILNLRLDYTVDFQSNTHLPTYWLFGHLLPKGEAPISPDTPVNRLVAQACGQQAFGCGEPFTRLCSISVGWLDATKRRILCGSGDPALEVPPGDYVFTASTCYTDSKGTRVCNSIARDLTLQ
jgi:hypothetical protein